MEYVLGNRLIYSLGKILFRLKYAVFSMERTRERDWICHREWCTCTCKTLNTSWGMGLQTCSKEWCSNGNVRVVRINTGRYIRNSRNYIQSTLLKVENLFLLADGGLWWGRLLGCDVDYSYQLGGMINLQPPALLSQFQSPYSLWNMDVAIEGSHTH